jgi:hypothetical protein
MRIALAAAAFLIAFDPGSASAGAGDVVACKKIADEHERLACFDRTSADLEKDMQASSEGLFGFLGLGATKQEDFGKSPSLPEGQKKIPQVASVTSKIVGYSQGYDGKPVFTFENGQVWRSQDPKRIHMKLNGEDVATVRRSLLGYLITVNDATYELSVVRVQ